jgi:hypothetical protein
MYVVPGNFRGWVRIAYKVKGAPPLQVVDGRYYIDVPQSGIVETSTSFKEGFARDEFCALQHGRRVPLVLGIDESRNGQVWGMETVILGEKESIEWRFFVGTRAEWVRARQSTSV